MHSSAQAGAGCTYSAVLRQRICLPADKWEINPQLSTWVAVLVLLCAAGDAAPVSASPQASAGLPASAGSPLQQCYAPEVRNPYLPQHPSYISRRSLRAPDGPAVRTAFAVCASKQARRITGAERWLNNIPGGVVCT